MYTHTYLQRRLYPLPLLKLPLQNALTTPTAFDPPQFAAVAVLAELNVQLEVLLEVILLLLAQRRHLYESDDGGPIYFCFLLLTTHERSVKYVADQQILPQRLTLLEL